MDALQDATEYRRLEAALEIAEERQEALLEAMPTATARLKRSGQFLDLKVPPDFVFFGDPRQFRGASIYEVLPADLARLVVGSLERALDTGHVQSFEYTIAINGGQRSHEARVVASGHDEGFLILHDVTTRKKAEAELVESHDRLRSLAGHVESVREEERKRIAREVHDVLGQALTALRIDIASIKKSLPERAAAVRERIDLADASIGTIIQTVRRIASDLRPGILDDLGIVAALEWQTEDFAARSGLACSFTGHVEDLDLDSDRSTALFRIFQEILTNVARHADASAVHVTLERQQDMLVLQVKDDGRGIREAEVAGAKSLGLLGIRERLLPWQGCVDFEGIPGQGTTVTITLPLRA